MNHVTCIRYELLTKRLKINNKTNIPNEIDCNKIKTPGFYIFKSKKTLWITELRTLKYV